MKKFTFILLLLATSASAQILHVPGSFTTIQSAINAANAGDTVLVADGTYYESITMADSIMVASNFIFELDSTHLLNTIIDGSQLISPHQTVVKFEYVDSTTVLAGFTIQNGKGTLFGTDISGGGVKFVYSGGKLMHNRIINNIVDGGPGHNYNAFGGGIAAMQNTPNKWIVLSNNFIGNNTCKSNALVCFGGGGYVKTSTRFANNIVKNNYSIGYGSASAQIGGFCIDGTAFPIVHSIVTQNEIINNHVQGSGELYIAGLAVLRATILVSDNKFIGNTISGGIISMTGGLLIGSTIGTAIVRNNLFEENISGNGSGLFVDADLTDTIFIENNSFYRNEASLMAGGLYAEDGVLIIRNNVFNANKAIDISGGAMLLFKTETNNNLDQIVNNTFANNTAEVAGGAIFSNVRKTVLLNNIFWNNSAGEGSDLFIDNGYSTLAYCDINQDNISGNATILEGMIFDDPDFCGPDNFEIELYSPCKDSGAEFLVVSENDTIYAPRYDIENRPRPYSHGYDMGAYENSVEVPGVQKLDRMQLAVYPNPFHSTLNCQYTLERDGYVIIKLFDGTGRAVFSETFYQKSGEHQVPLHIDGISNGLYILKIVSEDKVGSVVLVYN